MRRFVHIHMVELRLNAHRRGSHISQASLMGYPTLPLRAIPLAFERYSFSPSRHCPFLRLKMNRPRGALPCLKHARLKQAYRYTPIPVSLRSIPLRPWQPVSRFRPATALSNYTQLPHFSGIFSSAGMARLLPVRCVDRPAPEHPAAEFPTTCPRSCRQPG